MRFSVYAKWLKDYLDLSTPESIKEAYSRAPVYDIKGVQYVRIPEHRYKIYKRMKKK